MNLLSSWALVLLVFPFLYAFMGIRGHWRFGGSEKWLVASIVLLILALSRPVASQQPITTEQKGSDVVIAVDLSYSMRGNDLAPSRLEVAKNTLHTLVRQNLKERFGVIGFTTNAIILSPLTKDTELLLQLISGLDETQIITKSTYVMSALELARKMSHAPHLSVILLTDGGDEASYAKEAEFAREQGLVVNVVMLASQKGSTLSNPDGTLLKDEAGHIVVSMRNDQIEQLAHESGGEMIEGGDVDAIERALERQSVDERKSSATVVRYRELFWIPLVAALGAFMLAFTTLGEKVSAKWLALLMVIGVQSHGALLDGVYAAMGKWEYQNDRYERAAWWYGNIETAQGRFNRGLALYKNGQYQKALEQFTQVRTSDRSFKAAIYYHIGNCHIRLGQYEDAREALLKSLTLRYTKAADVNRRAIAQAEDQDKNLNVRKEKQDKFTPEDAASNRSGESKPAKEGGGSNMKSDMASGGGGDEGKQAQADPRLSMKQGKAQLSSRQYELINQRSVYETKPW